MYSQYTPHSYSVKTSCGVFIFFVSHLFQRVMYIYAPHLPLPHCAKYRVINDRVISQSGCKNLRHNGITNIISSRPSDADMIHGSIALDTSIIWNERWSHNYSICGWFLGDNKISIGCLIGHVEQVIAIMAVYRRRVQSSFMCHHKMHFNGYLENTISILWSFASWQVFVKHLWNFILNCFLPSKPGVRWSRCCLNANVS